MTNQERVRNNLQRIKTIEQRIEKAGLTTIKPLAQELAKTTRITIAILAAEVFTNV